jgi:protease secretion system membrane fusion protein
MVKSLLSLGKKSDVVDAGSASDAIENVAVPGSGRPGRIGLWALAIGFGGFLLWAALAPLDEGVPSQGHVGMCPMESVVISGGCHSENAGRC